MKGHTKERKRSEVEKKDREKKSDKRGRGRKVSGKEMKEVLFIWNFPPLLLLPLPPPSATLLLLFSFHPLGSCRALGMLATTFPAPPTNLLPFL